MSQVETHHRRPLNTRRKMFIASAGLTMVLLLGASTWFILHDRDPLPAAIRSHVTYTLYFPSDLPKGYHFLHKSARLESGVVFYNVADKKRSISVSQQSLGTNPPVLSSLSGFNKLDVPAGNAVIGTNGSTVTAIILTNTSLLTINGTSGTPQDVVVSIAKSMSSLPD